ncbi:hypothetical protein RJ640_017387 [Escallonia rubra]|uniref:DUF641 domain-containing protein n=1 Tax=Escallonia rubra TaxID=112253 RepID=A0AA88QZP4_9ASTE|nr:hypothetical protein RJ640_017387 [Escallonia rubra]
MDSIKPPSAPTKSKLSKKCHNIIHLKTATKSLSNNKFCLLIPQEKPKNGDPDHGSPHQCENEKAKNRAAVEAFVAKLFATISVLKAAYAELQMAQSPYNGDAIQVADQAVVDELKTLSQLKHSFLRKQVDPSPPHVTLLLSEIQEQQSLIKMYEINRKKLESEIDAKEAQISSLQKELNEIISYNKSTENKLNSSGCFSILDNVKLSSSNPEDFITVLHYAIRSVRNFVKLLIKEMEAAKWDIDTASNSIQPDVHFQNPNDRCFVFESFVCHEMFDGFSSPNFSLPNEASSSADHDDHSRRVLHFDRFKKLKSVNPVKYLKQNPHSTFGKFTRGKYLRLVHPKMEASFSGNLNQRKKISAWEYPETEFFKAFAEMGRRVWLMHCLGFSFEEDVSVFQVGRGARFSEVYMESVRDEMFAAAEGGLKVAFTVVPGFKVGKTVVQSQVYLSPVLTPAKR